MFDLSDGQQRVAMWMLQFPGADLPRYLRTWDMSDISLPYEKTHGAQDGTSLFRTGTDGLRYTGRLRPGSPGSTERIRETKVWCYPRDGCSNGRCVGAPDGPSDIRGPSDTTFDMCWIGMRIYIYIYMYYTHTYDYDYVHNYIHIHYLQCWILNSVNAP